LFTAAAAVRYRSSAYLEARHEEWVAVLSDKLGLDVQIGRLSYPLWNLALLEDVVLLDPETGHELVQTRYVEVTLADDRWHLTAGQPEVSAESLPLLVELLNHRLLRGQALKLAPLEFVARELTFRSADSAQTFRNVRAEIATTDSGKRAAATFEIAGMESPAPIELIIERSRGDGAPKTTCNLNTAETPLPCGALAPLWPWLKQLGDEATFTGDVSVEHSQAGATAQLRGRFDDVDLDRLVSQRFPHHKLTGRADVTFERLQLHGVTIAQMNGTLQTRGSGMVSRSLLEAAGQWLDLAPPQPLRLRDEVRYRQLAFGFRLDQEGLSLAGYADPSRDGVIMASATHDALLMESASPVVPAVFFIRALSPQSDVQVPATREAKPLFDLLPLPSLIPAGSDARPGAKVRLHSAS